MTDNESEGSEDRELFEHLVDQFGLHGKEAVSFLKTAQWLLATDPAGHAPRQAGAAAYCVREALDRLLPPELGRPRWQELSAEVVAAKRIFEAARGLPGTDEAGALDQLLAAIGELEEFRRTTKAGMRAASLVFWRHGRVFHHSAVLFATTSISSTNSTRMLFTGHLRSSRCGSCLEGL
jgi:hypothetical protein